MKNCITSVITKGLCRSNYQATLSYLNFIRDLFNVECSHCVILALFFAGEPRLGLNKSS